MTRVLVVEDDDATGRLLHVGLVDEGFETDVVGSAGAARSAVRAATIDVAVVDVGLPDGSGLDLMRELASEGIPVIILSGRGAEVDRVLGLELGADDYVVKPFSLRELTARIRRVLRSSPPRRRVQFGDVVVDLESREVTRGGVTVELTRREFDLLAHLVRAPRTVFSREELLRDVWISSTEWQTPATVTEHVRRLRRKLEPAPSAPRHLLTVSGAGYRFDP